jgi:hypothetical protein
MATNVCVGENTDEGDENYDDVVLPVIEDIKKYVSGLGFSTGGRLSNTSTSARNKLMTYVLLIQK